MNASLISLLIWDTMFDRWRLASSNCDGDGEVGLTSWPLAGRTNSLGQVIYLLHLSRISVLTRGLERTSTGFGKGHLLLALNELP